MQVKAEFDIGDLVSHSKRGYFGVIVEVLDGERHEYNALPIYKVEWEHGDWMYEIEDQLHLEVRAKNV